MQRLTDQQVAEQVQKLRGWELQGNRIDKEFRFGDFVEAMDFVNDVASLAEEANHHPDIAIHYNQVTLSLWTHDAGGLTRRDFDLAEKIDALNVP